MSAEEKSVQVKIDTELYKAAKKKLVEEGKTWQDLLLKHVKEYAGNSKKKLKSKK